MPAEQAAKCVSFMQWFLTCIRFLALEFYVGELCVWCTVCDCPSLCPSHASLERAGWFLRMACMLSTTLHLVHTLCNTCVYLYVVTLSVHTCLYLYDVIRFIWTSFIFVDIELRR